MGQQTTGSTWGDAWWNFNNWEETNKILLVVAMTMGRSRTVSTWGGGTSITAVDKNKWNTVSYRN